ncbi:trifunctional dihydropteroate synthetase [Malassezia vespertilionis]|uniref:Fol1p n=1 Tax=Malassezia vespertilionis TaxID=2020962 RepID=A0A2N1J6V8_9BASI|nr:trifunctional dihydropteroate synthetase [Malassezia vespertilionis]PKI82290.1 Fol1p [Malassezia vespertilionis]WFD07918.1 trifunctional dihydropteroate synthetase [Malassezia vespertilionis]
MLRYSARQGSASITGHGSRAAMSLARACEAVRPVHFRDTVSVRNLRVRMRVGLDGWNRAVPQPVNITVHLKTDVAQAGKSDALPQSLNYGQVYRALESHGAKHAYNDMGALARGIARVCIDECKAPWAEVYVALPRALLNAEHAGVSLVRGALQDAAQYDQLHIAAMEVDAILGLNPWEREARQRVVVHIACWHCMDVPVRYKALAESVGAFIAQSSFQTVESLVTGIAEIATLQCGFEKVAVRAEKPRAIMHADSASVEIVRDRAFFGAAPLRACDTWHSVAIALGANLGDRLANLQGALDRLAAHPDIQLIDTSFLYETKPMYYVDQPLFLNGACRILTTLSPHELLRVTQAIEVDVGRCKDNVPRNGPRAVDLDLLLYDDAHVQDGEHLLIPHPRIQERAFALHPLRDIWPHAEHPVLQRSIEQLLGTLLHTETYHPLEFSRVLPLGSGHLWRWGEKTLVMGILNVTPNSFSDSGAHFQLEDAMHSARAMVREGADILDVGGASTAPRAENVSPEEEAERVLPLIRQLVDDPHTCNTPISIDTFHASVAARALDAGAALVNDISGGMRDPAMLPLIAERKCPYILMHMRGDQHTMSALANYQDVGGEVCAELGERLAAALRAGIPRWNIILDPGIGFAKNTHSNLALIRSLTTINGPGGARGGLDALHNVPTQPKDTVDIAAPQCSLLRFPMLLGPSRKRFLAELIHEKDADIKGRVFATMAVCAVGIGTGSVDIIRVHDVRAGVDTARTTDAIARPAVCYSKDTP